MKRLIVQTEAGLNDMLNRLNRHAEDGGGFDTEFVPCEGWVRNPSLVALNFAVHEQDGYTGWYVPVGHTQLRGANGRFYQNVPLDPTLKKLRPWLESKRHRKVMHAAEVDSGLIKMKGIEVGDNIDCTQLMSYHYDENKIWQTGLYPYRLKEVAKKVLGVKMSTIPELTGKVPKSQDTSIEENKYDLRPVPIDLAAVYGTDDAIRTLQLKEWFEPELKAEGLYDYYRRLDVPLVRALRDLQINGIQIDQKRSAQYLAVMDGRQAQLEGFAFGMVGREFNLNSRQQLGAILFDELKYFDNAEDPNFTWVHPKTGKVYTGTLPPEFTPTGLYKTSDDVMVKLAEKGYQLPVYLREYGDITKFSGTYLRPFMDVPDGRYHASLWQVGTVTGRFSGDMQQVPRDPLVICPGCGGIGLGRFTKTHYVCACKAKTTVKKIEKTDSSIDIRVLVIPARGCWLIVADYNQLELRILAHFSHDPVLIDAYLRGLDLHQATADAADISRQDAKPINFALVYGLSLSSLIEMFGEEKGRRLFALLRLKYEVLLKYTAAVHYQVHLDEYVSTLAGHKRRLPEINNPDDWYARGYAERQAFNCLIQGSGADVMKMAQLALFRHIPEARQILQVHDEILFEFRGSRMQALACAREIKKIMENIVRLDVPLIADPGVGTNWRLAKAA